MGGPMCKCRNITLKRGQNGQRPSGTSENDADGNPISRSNQNPILDTQLYEMAFPGGEITGLVANIIAESMNALCDVDRMNTSYQRYSLITERMVQILVQRTKRQQSKGERSFRSQQLVKIFVASGRTAPHCGQSQRILRSQTQSRFPNMPQHRAPNVNQHVTGEFFMS